MSATQSWHHDPPWFTQTTVGLRTTVEEILLHWTTRNTGSTRGLSTVLYCPLEKSRRDPGKKIYLLCLERD